MKRGFLLRAEGKKAVAKRRGAQKVTEYSTSTSEPGPLPQNLKSLNADKETYVKLDYGTLTEEEKALPIDYDFKKSKFIPKETDANITEYSDNTRVVTTIPQPVRDGEIQSQWILNGSTKGKVLKAPGYPARIPKPSRPDLYEVRSTADMGVGLFAKRNIKRGDLILAERPLLVSPRAMGGGWSGEIADHYTEQQIKQIAILEFEEFLELAVGRLSKEDQADYRALHNAHTGDGSGPLLGIVRSNGYGIGNLYDGSDKTAMYGAVCKIGSRINHSCKPNVKYHFKLNSFSMQFYALRDVTAGEQLFYSYCNIKSNLTDRQAELAPYGFLCKCPACLNATPETDKLRTTLGTQIPRIMTLLEHSPETTLKEALRLEEDMVNEGLDVEAQFIQLAVAICLAYAKLGRREESEKYGSLVKALQKYFSNDD